MKKIILLIVFVMASFCSARSVKQVLQDGQGNFDPWNTTRWADWYDPANPGQLKYRFVIDCNITFASGHNTLSTAWCPVMSANHESPVMLFYIDSSSYGYTVNGNGQYIDIRPAAYRSGGVPGHESITTLYNYPYDAATRTTSATGFYVNQPYNASKSPTIVSNLKLYGFSKAVTTHMDHRQPVTFTNCELRRNQFPAYIHGVCSIVNSQIKENYTGIYVDKEAQGCRFANNQFRDNQYQQEWRHYYGDIQMDSASRCFIEGNEFQETIATSGPYYRVGIKFYRNKGEIDLVRPNPSGFILVRNNSFTGYTIACDVASRQGLDYKDLAAEGRDFAYYNRFENNTFANCLFGIKINNSGNTIRGNTFSNVSYPVLLHNMFFSLTENTITDQPGTNVYHWLMNSEWYNYVFGSWYGRDLFDVERSNCNGSITESEKYVHIRTDGTPNVESYSGPATFVIADTQLVGAENRAHDISGDQFVNMTDIYAFCENWLRDDCNSVNSLCGGADVTGDGKVNLKDYSMIAGDWLCGNNMKDVYMPAGKTPLDIAVGDFWPENPGDEVAAVWNEKMTDVDGTDYYTIVMYDSNGIENNRCGRGQIKYTSIVAGNFIDKISSVLDWDGVTRDITCAGDEIAAVSSNPDVNGCYPIYIFGASRKKPLVTLLGTNTTPSKAMAAGNFYTTDSLDELAVIFNGGTYMEIHKPSTASYLSKITVAANIKDIAGGNFHQSYAGDEIAGIDTLSAQIYFYRVGYSAQYFATAGVVGGAVWSHIAAGEFYNGTAPRQEVAVSSSVATNGIYKIYCYEIARTTAVKEIAQDVLGVSPAELDAGTFPIPQTLGLYERAQGFYCNDYTSTMSGWGSNVAVLPSAPQTTATPVFWLNAAPTDNTKKYLKVTPIAR